MANPSSIKVQKKKQLRRSLRTLRNLVHSNSNDVNTILSDAFVCIIDSVKKIEELQKELQTMVPIQHQPPPVEVKVEEQGESKYQLNVTSPSEDGKNYFTLIVGAIEEKGINIISASVSRLFWFNMEAIVEVTQAIDSSVLTEIIFKAIGKCGVN
ncbi:hypothetical protein SOVF_057720 [Spinacia oleracea]|uniref:Plant bHLH transcription factor ACT-like domain-containing protein n=1 Tax=Spinacia oleracea TaxID=3562 RepID=A0A9R0II20_SPIOL|nr:uncharacterized protein LOC110789376 [Spinacia oleracea]KNA19801.1 hypothetical protein SOVF_057720 [Spinacia oleracea]